MSVVPNPGCPLPFETLGSGPDLPISDGPHGDAIGYSDPDRDEFTESIRSADEARRSLVSQPSSNPAAHLALAKFASTTLEEALQHFTASREAALEVLGGPHVPRNRCLVSQSHGWAITDLRPYWRATVGMANTLRKLGHVQSALPLYLELVEYENDT